MGDDSLNRQLERALRTAYAEAYPHERKRVIKLPKSRDSEPSDFKLSGNKERLRIHLSKNAVLKNMQDDAAAFEGWALALKAWRCVENVELDWEVPDSEDKRFGHYRRFLYRVGAFEKLFSPGWFSVRNSERLDLKNNRNLTINIATAAPRDPALGSKEAALEKYLTGSNEFANTFRLSSSSRQFPVGLRDTETKKGIFAGGKSAIDIVGIGTDGMLWVFELKAEKNQRLGILSELLFYCSMMRDLAEGKFGYERRESKDTGRMHPREVVGRKKICGCLLAPGFHPLLAGNRIVNLLNKAAEANDDAVRYCSYILSREPFSFERVVSDYK